jgi:phosphatidyl-myo-inositol alpha-mannosyltransferase
VPGRRAPSLGPVRVGLVCPYSLAVWGGVQGQVLGLARALRARGLYARVLAPCDGLPPEPFVTPLGNSVPYAQNGSMAPVAPDPAAQLRLMGALWDEQFDVVHLHEPIAPGPTMTTLVLKPAPLVGTFHASGHIGWYRWARPVVRRLASRLDLSCAVSPAAADMAGRHLGGRYEILFNGVEVDRWAQAEPVPTSGPTIFFLGRHEPRKGLAVLLEAMQWLPSDVQVWIGGTGPETEALRRRYRGDPRLEWLGAISDADKAARLRGADVFCVPSLGGESFGVVLLEAMASGTTVVASDIPAYDEVARGGRDAVLSRVGDPVDLAKALLRALEGGPEVSGLVDSGRSRAQSFSMAALAERYHERYLALLDR